MNEEMEIGRIAPGKVYRYFKELPRGCQNALYRVEAFILDVPSYQEKVLMQALTGKDAGLLFCITPTNFALRYVPHETAMRPEPAVAREPAPEKIADFSTHGLH